MPKKIYIRTFGCQMNERDSEHVIAQFLDHGYQLSDDAKKADVILFNTCSVRQHAEDKVWSALGRLKKITYQESNIKDTHQYSKHNTQYTIRNTPVIGVIGCMAERIKSAIIKKMPSVDLVCGPNDLPHIYEHVAAIQKERTAIVAVGSKQRSPSFYKSLYQSDTQHSYVVIMEGCNNFCSYCVVPYVRGRERSRPYKDIITEIKTLTQDGIASVTLLGQNVNSYSGGCDFPELLRKVNAIAGLKEITFVTSHPKDASKKLFEAVRDCGKVKNFLHLPVQSGSNRILKLMKRGYTSEKYLRSIELFRTINPGAILATDIIVGFPGETEKDFHDTYNLIKQAQCDFAYIFKYSPRPGTKAAELPDDVPFAIKKKRNNQLLALQKAISHERKKARNTT